MKFLQNIYRDRDKQNVFVVNVRPSCPLAIRPGDELLEINGRLLNKISHVAASAVVRECCDQHQNIEIVLRRRNGALVSYRLQLVFKN